MADVKIIDIDGEQWNIKDQDARNKNVEQDTKIENLTTEINVAKRELERFYYDANTDRTVLQNRVEAMLYCYNNSKSPVATIRYEWGYFYQVILPSIDLNFQPAFVEIAHSGEINIFLIKDRLTYKVQRSI